MKQSVLFVCVHNSARSQMAEAFLNQRCPRDFVAQSAGLEPGTLNALAVVAMSEVGIDISDRQTKSIFDLFKRGKYYSYVITVCDETSAERCPIFPGGTRRLQWSFPDPAAAEGTSEERLAQTRLVRDQIRAQIDAWCAEACRLAAQMGGIYSSTAALQLGVLDTRAAVDDRYGASLYAPQAKQTKITGPVSLVN